METYFNGIEKRNQQIKGWKIVSGADRKMSISISILCPYIFFYLCSLNGKCNSPFLINYHHRHHNHSYCNGPYLMQKERTLNISKYDSNMAVEGELAILPLLHKAWGSLWILNIHLCKASSICWHKCVWLCILRPCLMNSLPFSKFWYNLPSIPFSWKLDVLIL